MSKERIYRRAHSPYWYINVAIAGRRRIRRSTKTSERKEAAKIAAKVIAAEWKRFTHGDDAALTFSDAVMNYVIEGKDATYLPPLVSYFQDMPVRGISAGAIRSAARVLYPKCSAATWNRQVITPARAVI